MDDRTTEQERPLHILTLNVNGLKTNGNKLLNELERLESENNAVDVLFLTETHIGKYERNIDVLTTDRENWRTYFTYYTSRSKGAAILVKKRRQFKILHEICHETGNYVILRCLISGKICTFVSVYHHRYDSGLLKELSEKINPMQTDILVVGGDFNTALDEEKDRRSILYDYYHNKIRKELVEFMNEHKLIDAWRKKHPTKIEYTYKVNKCGISRLDYFFINADKWELVQDCRIMKLEISNHWPVSLILHLKTPERQIFSCTVHDLPRDEDFTELYPDIILLAKGKTKDEDYIKRLQEERKEKKRTVLWSDHSNAAILVTKKQRDMHILFTAYHKNYVILHCKVFGMLHTFVSACHPTENNLKNMLREIMPSYSGRIVIGGDFSTSDQMIMELEKKHNFKKHAGGSMQLPYLIHAQLGKDCKFKEQKILHQSYFSLILRLPKMNPENADDITAET